jgi:MFS family permease
LTSAEVGTFAGTFKGLAGMAGTLIGGVLVARVARNDDRWKLWAPAIMSALAEPVFALCTLTASFALSVAMLGIFSLLVGFQLGPIFAIAQTVARSGMRALAAATLLLTATCLGQGLGPLLVGACSDALAPQQGADAIRYALLTASVATVLGAGCFVWAARWVCADVARPTH